MDLFIEENRLLKEQLKSLYEEKNLQDKLVVKGHCYYIQKGDGMWDGPFCTTCWDKDRKLIRMHISNGMGFDMADCHVYKFGTSYIN